MINGTNVLRDDNPRWASINLLETPPVQAGPRLEAAGWLADIASRTTDLLHEAGERLHAASDTEAGWRRWKVTELHCGLTHRYRDPRFDRLTARDGAR